MNCGTPSISVIIPAFNEECYLPATLQALENSASLLRSREGVNTEVIVVDNGSLDATANVARSLGARVIAESEHNIARVRNRGAATALGGALVFLDADTRMPEELLPRIHQVFCRSGLCGRRRGYGIPAKEVEYPGVFGLMADTRQGGRSSTRRNTILSSGHLHLAGRL